MEVINGGFLIIDHLERPDDFEGEMILIDRMKEIGQEIIALMLQDHLERESFADQAILGFDLNTMAFEVIWPVFDNDFGINFSFQFKNIIIFDS